MNKEERLEFEEAQKTVAAWCMTMVDTGNNPMSIKVTRTDGSVKRLTITAEVEDITDELGN